MNKLPIAKRVQILNMMVEGSSMRSISRVADVSYNAVDKMLRDAGEACLDMHDELVRGVQSKAVQADEIWSFVQHKEKNRATAKTASAETGDCWTWTAIDADSKLMISYLVGKRSRTSGEAFMRDLASRVAERIQLTTDGFGVYLKAIEKAFGGEVDHAMLTKIYANVAPMKGETRYSPMECVGTKTDVCCGNPDVAKINTSYVERANLTIRMGNRRFTRLTNAHSKKYANHLYALAIFFMHYNFCRIHKSLRVTPAMAAGIADHVWSLEEIIERMDAMQPEPAPRGPYKKRKAA
jgi:IS1 family transposase